MQTLHRIAAAGTTALVLLAGATAAADAGSGDVVRRGDCSGRADWKLKVGPEDGRLEVEGEIDSNRSGQRWTWRLLHDGDLVDHGSRLTRGTSGSFTVRRLVADRSGTDRLVFVARRPATGQTCRGVVRF